MSALVDLIAKILPMNAASRLTGRFVRIQFPTPIQRFLNRLFVTFFGIDVSEAAFPLENYRTVQEVFTRALRPGARKIVGPVCSPADGAVTQSCAVESIDRVIQVKGHDYSIPKLIWDVPRPTKTLDAFAWYHVVYLAPHNYHRVHSPISGTVRVIRHIPGELWSVSPALIHYVPNLFARNERVVFEITDQHGDIVYVVMVGAFNVGCISSRLAPGFESNRGGQRISEISVNNGKIDCGDELGIFHLGSTVVTIFPKAYTTRHSFVQCNTNTPILMGQSITR